MPEVKIKSYYLYVLLCSNGKYYTGVTNNIKRRFYEHQEGLISSCFTHDKRPLKLMYIEEYSDIVLAISREKQIKGWSKKKKEALMTGDYRRLIELSNPLRQAQGDTDLY